MRTERLFLTPQEAREVLQQYYEGTTTDREEDSWPARPPTVANSMPTAPSWACWPWAKRCTDRVAPRC